MIGVAIKVLRGAAKAVLVVLAAIALLVGVAWMFLQTRRGGELVRRLALPRVNAAIAGQLALGRFAFGGDRITLEDIALTDPEGRPVASAEEIDVSFSPLALLRRHVEVTRLRIRRPELALVQDGRGLNLARALAPRRPPAAAHGGPPEAANGGTRLRLDVGSFIVSDGAIDYRSVADGQDGQDGKDRHVHVADLSVRAGAHFARGRLSADAAVTVRGGRADLRGAFDTAARRGHAAAEVSVRGVSLTLEGRLDGDAVDAHAAIEAADLDRAARALARDFGLPRIAIAGNGRIDVACGGTVAAPSLRAAARFPRLAVGGTAARDLTASAQIPDLRLPAALDADAGVSAVSLGGRKLRAATVTLRAAGRHITGRAAVAAPQPLRIDLAGEREAAGAIAIDALSLRYPEATWTLRRRARLSVAGGAIALSGFEVGAGAQKLTADLRVGGGRSTARVTLSRLDLSRLPGALLPREAGLGGTVDASVDVRADVGEAPRVVVRATLAGGRLHGHRDLSLDVAGRLERGRARGELRARGLGVAAQASFDLPGAWPPRNVRAPLALTVDTGDVDLAAVARAVAEASGGPPARLAGHARVAVRLDGRVGQPRLQVDVAGRGLAFDDRRIGDLALSVNGEGDGALAAQITSTAPAHTRIDVTTPLSLRAIVRRPPTAETLARTRFELRGTIDRLPLSVLAGVAGPSHGAPARLRGTLSSAISVTGTAWEPEGKVTVDVAGAATDSFPPTDARIEADFEREGVAARVRVVRRQQPLLAAESRLGAPVGDLFRPARLAAASVHLRAVVGPYLIQRLGLPPLEDRQPPRQLAGRLHADLAVDGTVAAPRVVMHAQAADIRLDKTEIGFAEIEARYADRRAKLDARLSSQGGGTLRAQASLGADLGYPAVSRGLDLRRAPLDARLDAQRFDLRGASGAVQALRTVGGLLTASLALRGPLAAPRFSGRLEWTDGVVVVSGFGAYNKIHLALHGDDRGLKLDELSAASGSGTARLTGSANLAAGRGYDVAADAKLDKFPIYNQGQPLAVVSLQSRLGGRVALADSHLALDIDHANIELKDAKHKELQPLDAPADIVLVDAGTPLNKAQAAKLRALLDAGHAPAVAASPHRPPTFRLRVNAPRHLWVSGKDARLELGLSPDFRVSLGDRPEIRGQVTVHRGRVDVFGRRFDLKQDSTVTFAGRPDRPELDVRAEHVNTTENITVLLTAKGPLDKMTVTVTSPNRPDLGESQLYTLIITGHLQFGGNGTTSASPSAEAASILGGILASKLQSALAHRLPLDVFTIDVGGEGVSGTKLEAGRYVTDRLYAGYIGRVGSDPTRYQNRNAVHLEYQITSRWEIEGEYGDLGTGTADLMWKKNY